MLLTLSEALKFTRLDAVTYCLGAAPKIRRCIFDGKDGRELGISPVNHLYFTSLFYFMRPLIYSPAYDFRKFLGLTYRHLVSISFPLHVSVSVYTKQVRHLFL